MDLEKPIAFQSVEPSHPPLAEIISLAIGFPTAGKVRNTLSQYSKPNHYIIGCFVESKLAGMIGVVLDNGHATIKHIAVLPKYRLHGIGRALIQHVLQHFCLNA